LVIIFQKIKGDYHMKKVWKWVIGIVVVLVVVAALVGGAFLLRSHFANVISLRANQPGVQIPGNGWGDRDGSRRFPGMMPYGNYGWGGGMHMRGFGGMGLFGGLIGGLFSLVILALVVLGILWLVNRLRKPAAAAAPLAVAPVADVAPAAPVSVVHPCPKCGEPVQEGWKHCPNCGKRQKPA
jgi:uncharacterized membrane protein